MERQTHVAPVRSVPVGGTCLNYLNQLGRLLVQMGQTGQLG